jgi:hypothetical protein
VLLPKQHLSQFCEIPRNYQLLGINIDHRKDESTATNNFLRLTSTDANVKIDMPIQSSIVTKDIMVRVNIHAYHGKKLVRHPL